MPRVIRAQGDGLPPSMQVSYEVIGRGVHGTIYGLVGVSLSHYEALLHGGDKFAVSFLRPHGSELANDATYHMLIEVGRLQAEVFFRASVGGNSELALSAMPTAAPKGIHLPTIRKNQFQVRIPTLNVYSYATVAPGAEGVLLFEWFIPGGAGIAAVGGSEGFTEWIFAPNVSYLISLTNRSGGPIQFAMGLEWSEF